ncbi:MAG: fibronectin type III domain-containing protein [Patescibacteria group bacterium]
MKMKLRVLSKVFAASTIAMLCFASLLSLGYSAIAATATPASDQITTHNVNAQADHQIVFKTPTGVDQSTDTVTVYLPDFIFGSLAITDIDLHHGPVTGFENTDPIAAVQGAGIWGASIVGKTITLTAPTDAAPGTIPAGQYIAIRIGTNAGGTHRLTNPASVMSAQVTIGGAFGDSNTIGVPIIDSGSLSVSATVVATSTPPPPPPGGGGGGGGTPVNPPVISNIQVINITSFSARITWNTDKSSDSSVAYGFTSAHASGTVSNGTYTFSHSIDLTGLTPSTQYHFVVTSVDSALLSSTSGDQVFTTLGDVTPPVISNVHVANITDSSGIVMWNTDEPANSYVEYGTSTSYGSSGSSAGYVTTHAISLSGLAEGTLYHYRVTSADIAGNIATSPDNVFTTTIDTTPPTNATLTATPGDTVVGLEWSTPPEPDFIGTKVMRKTVGFPTGPGDGTVVYDGSATSTLDIGLVNGTTYYYGAYAYDTHHNYASGALATAIPFGPTPTSTPPVPPTPTSTPPVPPTPTSTPPVPPTPTSTPPVPPTPTSTLPTPPSGTSTVPLVPAPAATTTVPQVPPSAIIPGAVSINVIFSTQDGSIVLTPDASGQIGVLNGTTVLATLPIIGLGKSATLATLTIGGSIYSLALSPDGSAYTATFVAPVPGIYPSIATINFQDGSVGQAAYTINSQYGGTVVEEGTSGPTKQTVPSASVQVFRQQQGIWAPYGSPFQTSNDGTYGLIVPNGRYYAEVTKSGYRKKVSVPVEVGQNVYNDTLSLIRIPSITEIPAGTPLSAALAVVASNASEQFVYGVKIARDAVQAPEVQQANAIAAPTLLAVTIANSASAISFFNLLAYLQYLFTQPILLFGRRKKKKWGVIFNSLTKQPIDLAIVRLIHFESKLVMQTVVTDKFGRYRFLVQKGNYLLEVVKPGYVFPTTYLTDKKEDVDYLDLYHGEKLENESDSVVASNIPLDPITSEETPRRVLMRKTFRLVRHGLAFSGIPFGIVVLIVTPGVPTALLLLAQIGVYILFRRLALPAKARGWGVALDAKTKQPQRGVIVRIFDKKFNKLLETQVTDRNGKYGFFVRRNIYYITAEKAGYNKFTSPDIDLSQKDEAVIDQNIVLLPVDR